MVRDELSVLSAFPSRKQHPAALTALIETLRL
jgi:hypothetical protein